MLLPEDIHPDSTLFYNGALIIKALLTLRKVNLLDLYIEAKGEGGMTMPIFVLSLDWLFLANCVTVDEEGLVSLCS